MILTVHAFWIPLLLTGFCLGMMFRPYRKSSDYDFGEIFRVFWLIPVGFVWAAYCGLGWWMSGT